MSDVKLFRCPPTDLRCYQPKERHEVTYAVSYTYNGGTVINDEWYAGYEVPAPLIAPGFVLIGIGVGLQLNATPPYATGVIIPESGVKEGLYMDCDGVWKRKEVEE